MALIADFLLAAGALAAAFYCFVLGQRLKKFNNLEKGMGGAVAVLSAQVDDLERSLAAAQQTASESTDELSALTSRAEDVRRQLELQIAALHDVVPEQAAANGNAAANSLSTQSQSGEPLFVRHRMARRVS